jgi:3-oxoacyl-(acyl-carrier-protein) synthase
MSAGRVVVTGMGVLAPQAHGLAAFEAALREGQSGIRGSAAMRERGFECQVAGIPENLEALAAAYFDERTLFGMDRSVIMACIAGLDCWRDAGFELPSREEPDWDTGVALGSGIGSLETAGSQLVPRVDEGRVRRLGSAMAERVMISSGAARLAGLLAIGGRTVSLSAACSTGCEAIMEGWWAIREGRAQRVLAGGFEGDSLYCWAPFDALRVLSRRFNDAPERASRPMSRTAGGFVPASGAGVLMLESLASAQARGARIYAELLGGAVNCGGQVQGGSMTAPNPCAVRRCIQQAFRAANVDPGELAFINGHLSATFADPHEVNNWAEALGIRHRMPWIQSTKSLVGHTLGAAGAIETIATVLQLRGGFIHPSANCEDPHPALEWCADRIPQQAVPCAGAVAAKASFGFGDVNACLLMRRWNNPMERGTS